MFDVRRLFAGFAHRAPRGARERGIDALARGELPGALAHFDAALADSEVAAQRASLHNKRGVVLVEMRRRDDALAAFADALAVDERCAPALANIGNLLFEDGHDLDAVDYYEAAIRADERYDVAYRNLGVALKRLGRRAEAVSALRTAARLAGRRRLWRA